MMREIGIGSFLLTQSEVIVSDPCYDIPQFGDCQAFLTGVKTGEWVASIIEKGRTDCVTELVATHKGFRVLPQWELMSGYIGVDSGQAGIFQKSVYREDSLIDDCLIDEIIGDNESGAKFYTACCNLTASWRNGGFTAGVLQTGGCVSQSGHGDSDYDYFVARDGEEIVGIRIVFVDMEDF